MEPRVSAELRLILKWTPEEQREVLNALAGELGVEVRPKLWHTTIDSCDDHLCDLCANTDATGRHCPYVGLGLDRCSGIIGHKCYFRPKPAPAEVEPMSETLADIAGLGAKAADHSGDANEKQAAADMAWLASTAQKCDQGLRVDAGVPCGVELVSIDVNGKQTIIGSGATLGLAIQDARGRES